MRFTRSSMTKSATAKLAAGHPAFRLFFWYTAREDRRNAARDVQRIRLRPGDRIVVTRTDPPTRRKRRRARRDGAT